MILLFLICLITFSFTIKFSKGISPARVFFFLWVIIIGFYCLQLYDFVSISNTTIIILFIGICSWGVGSFASSILSNKIKINTNNIVLIPNNIIYVSYRYRIALIIMIIIMMIASFNGIISLLSGATLHDIRYLMRDEILSSSGIYNMVYLYIGTPLSYLILHYNVIRIMNNKYIKESIITIVFIIFTSLTSIGGRFILYYAGIDFLAFYVLKKKTKDEVFFQKEDKKSKRILILFISILTLMFIYITIKGGSEFFDTIYAYMCGCITLLEVKIKEFSLKSSFSYGFTSLNGFLRPFFSILVMFGMISGLPSLALTAENNLLLVEKVSFITQSNQTYNGFVSVFYAFYVDFGIVGVAIMSFIWGYISTKIYKKLIMRNTTKNQLLYFMILQALAISMLKFAFVDFQYALQYFYFLLIFIKPKETFKIKNRTNEGA